MVDPSAVQAYNNWKLVVEQCGKAMSDHLKEFLATARLTAMTTTRAVFTLADLRSLPTYDLVVFDEASQVGIAHALALAPLGRRVLFTDRRDMFPLLVDGLGHLRELRRPMSGGRSSGSGSRRCCRSTGRSQPPSWHPEVPGGPYRTTLWPGSRRTMAALWRADGPGLTRPPLPNTIAPCEPLLT